MRATSEDGRACWLGMVTAEDRPAWLPASEVAAHRRSAEREAERLRREREAAAVAAEEEVAARLHRARLIEASTGRPSVPSVAEVLAREDRRSDEAMARQELRADVAAGSVVDLDAPVSVDELAKARQARGARQARELGEDLAAAGQPVAGAAYGALIGGKRP